MGRERPRKRIANELRPARVEVNVPDGAPDLRLVRQLVSALQLLEHVSGLASRVIPPTREPRQRAGEPESHVDLVDQVEVIGHHDERGTSGNRAGDRIPQHARFCPRAEQWTPADRLRDEMMHARRGCRTDARRRPAPRDDRRVSE
jgi:hypothetical protein